MTGLCVSDPIALAAVERPDEIMSFVTTLLAGDDSVEPYRVRMYTYCMLPRSFRSPSVKQSLQDRTDIWRNVTI